MRSHAQGGFLKNHYEKIIALLVTGGLVAVWIMLAMRIVALKADSQRFVTELDQIKPMHLKAAVEDGGTYERAKEQISKPFQISAHTNLLLVPETRVWCVDCRRPIPYLDAVCPFCKAGQPPIDKQDIDGDGMPDLWEEKYGLNPRDPSDAVRDDDGDGFTNLEEYRADPQTSPKERTDVPSVAFKLFVDKIDAQPFLLLFKSLLRMPDGGYKFGINARDRSRTHIVKLGDVVEGFKVEKFELKFEEVTTPAGKQKVNKSVLTLSRAEKLIPLVYNQEQAFSEYKAHLVFKVDNSTYAVKKGDVFTVADRKYKVIEVDIQTNVVVIEHELDGKRLSIGKPIQSTETQQKPE
jgi:hypothetical protein